MDHFPQIILILICFIIPIYFIYYKSDKIHFSIIWLGIVITVDIFNSQKYLNLAGLILFGACVLPYNLKNYKELKGNTSLYIVAGYLLFLFSLGVYHGFLFPWEDLTGQRGFNYRAQMRSILYFGRTFLEWSTIVFLIIQLQKNKNTFSILLKSIFISSIFLALGTVLEIVFKFDFYYFFTGGREYINPTRARGFAYEPRGLSQNMAYAILLTPFVNFSKWKFAFIPLFLLCGFYLTLSFTGYAILTAGVGVLIISFALLRLKELCKFKIPILIGSIVILAICAVILNLLPDESTYHLKERLNIVLSGNIVNKLEVFDAATINFLNHNPKYYLLGTGPGTIYLPASEYILERDNYIWNNRFEALPHMGAILAIANSGLVGLLILIIAFALSIFRNLKLKKNDLIVGILLTALYFIQTRYFYILGFALLLYKLKSENQHYVSKPDTN